MESSKSSNILYVKAGSLIESTIAITIITISLLIALKLYIVILDNSLSLKKIKVQYEVDKIFNETKLDKSFNSEIYNYKNYRIRKEINTYEGTKNLLKVSFFAETKSDTTTFHYLIKHENK